MQKGRRFSFTFSSLLALGCTGHIEGSTPNSAGISAPSAAAGGAGSRFGDAAADPSAAGPLPLRILTGAEYQNTVRDLLGVEVKVAQVFPAESSAETGFSKVQKLDQGGVGAYQNVALQVAELATGKLGEITSCIEALPSSERSCVETFLNDFGPKAYRRPLTSVEVSRYLDHYESTLRRGLSLTPAESSKLLLATLLQSPHFLYHWETSADPPLREENVIKLGAHQLGARLSYLLWGSMPDDALFRAASSGKLADSAQVEQQARRLLADVKAERTIADFHAQWLGLSALPRLGKSSGIYPMWNAELGQAMADEVRLFAANVLLRGDGRFLTLMTSRSTFVNEALAGVYGISGVSGSQLTARELPAGERLGILTLAGFLTAHSGETEGNPTFRGKFLRERLLCETLPAAPGNIPPLPAPAANVSLRERHLQHAAVSPCKDCHLLMDPIGFGLNNFDALGRYHASESGNPVDASGQIMGLDGADPRFEGPLQLVSLLAESEQVRDCVAKEWFRYALSRREAAPDRASFDRAYAAFKASNYDVRELLVGLTTTRSFRYRSIDDGEMVQ